MKPVIGRPRTRPDSEFAIQARKYAAEWYARNKDRVLSNRRLKPKESDRIRDKARRTRKRLEVIARLGGCCTCCGESNWKFLAIDHKNNNGAEERRRGAGPDKLVNKILWMENPEDEYQLHCHNCNMAREFYGICPHKGEGELKRATAVEATIVELPAREVCPTVDLAEVELSTDCMFCGSPFPFIPVDGKAKPVFCKEDCRDAWRESRSRPVSPSKDVLYDLYVTQHLSTPTIGRLLGVSYGCVGAWLRKAGIEIRPPGKWATDICMAVGCDLPSFKRVSKGKVIGSWCEKHYRDKQAMYRDNAKRRKAAQQ